MRERNIKQGFSQERNGKISQNLDELVAGDAVKQNDLREDFCLDTMKMNLPALKLVKGSSWGVLISYGVH